MTQTLAAIVIVAFAAYRLAAAIALDTISEPFRAWVYERGHNALPEFILDDVAEEAQQPVIGPLGSGVSAESVYGRPGLIVSSFEIEGVLQERKKGIYASGWHWFYGLISCPFCCGWWLGLAGWWAYTGELFTSRAWAIQAVAVAGVQSAIPSNRPN